MVTGWEAQLASQQKEGCHQVTIELSDQFEELTADVISHTAFGSSYKGSKCSRHSRSCSSSPSQHFSMSKFQDSGQGSKSAVALDACCPINDPE